VGLDKLELKVIPVGVVFIAAAIMKAVAWLMPQLKFSLGGSHYLAIAFVLIGTLIVLSGAFSFRRARTTLDPRHPDATEHLVTEGIYQFTRNPMYLGFLFILFGWFCFLNNWLAMVGLVFYWLYMNRFQIKPEERYMLAKFGDAYKQYKASVRRWL